MLVLGAGGLGAPLLQYLAAAGIGTLGVVDDDTVDLSNLQRQVIHRTGDIGVAKVASAERALAEINPEVTVRAHGERLTAANAERLVADYDLVADGSDNFATRYLLNDTCFRLRKPLVAAAILRFDGQISTYKAWQGAGHPCLRCIFPEAPSEDAVPSCAQAGVLGALAGTLGAMQATEVVKEILGIGRSLSGRLLTYDALDGSCEEMAIAKRPHCPTCGHAMSLRRPLDHPALRQVRGRALCAGDGERRPRGQPVGRPVLHHGRPAGADEPPPAPRLAARCDEPRSAASATSRRCCRPASSLARASSCARWDCAPSASIVRRCAATFPSPWPGS